MTLSFDPLQTKPPARRIAEPSRRRVIRTAALEEVFANVPKWQIEHRQLSATEGISQSAMMIAGAVGLASNKFGARIQARGTAPQGQMSLAFDMAGRPDRRFGGRPLDRNDVLIGLDGAELDYATPAGFLGLALVIPVEPLAAALDRHALSGGGLARYRSVRICAAPRVQLAEVWRFMAQLTRLLHAEQLPPLSTAVHGFLQAEIVDMAATLLRHHAGQDEPDPLCLWHHRRPIVRRAEEYMRANLGEPIMLHSICAAAKASERTVEYAFQDIYGMGAKKFLKILRLHEARRQLRAADPQRAVVQEIAQNVGFWHMGHFSHDYRSLFGEPPSETFARRQIGLAE